MDGAKFDIKCENVHNACSTFQNFMLRYKIEKYYFTTNLRISLKITRRNLSWLIFLDRETCILYELTVSRKLLKLSCALHHIS